MDQLKNLVDPNNKKCHFCLQSIVDPVSLGDLYELEDVVTHYFCLLLSNDVEQNGSDTDGILGFLPKDIKKGLEKSKGNLCYYCHKKGATIICCQKKCPVKFHLPCGLIKSCMPQFISQFNSFCVNHRPKQIIPRTVTDNAKLYKPVCVVCYDSIFVSDSYDSLWAPCCINTWYHRRCVQSMATSAGYFFKCAKCNNNDEFLSHMLKFGIFVPERDASWELEPNAYQELLHRHDTCDAADCLCPHGRNHPGLGTRWELVLCDTCGSRGIHKKCGSLKMNVPDWECDDCKPVSILYAQSKAMKKFAIKGEPHITLHRLNMESADIDRSDEEVADENEDSSNSPPADDSKKEDKPDGKENLTENIVNIKPGPLSYKFKVLRRRIGFCESESESEGKREETRKEKVVEEVEEEVDDDIIDVVEVSHRKILDTIVLDDDNVDEVVPEVTKPTVKKRRIGPKSKTKQFREDDDEDVREKEVNGSIQIVEGNIGETIDVELKEDVQNTCADEPNNHEINVSVPISFLETIESPSGQQTPPQSYFVIDGKKYFVLQDNVTPVSDGNNSVLTLQLTLPPTVDGNSLSVGIASHDSVRPDNQASQQTPVQRVPPLPVTNFDSSYQNYPQLNMTAGEETPTVQTGINYVVSDCVSNKQNLTDWHQQQQQSNRGFRNAGLPITISQIPGRSDAAASTTSTPIRTVNVPNVQGQSLLRNTLMVPPSYSATRVVHTAGKNNVAMPTTNSVPPTVGTAGQTALRNNAVMPTSNSIPPTVGTVGQTAVRNNTVMPNYNSAVPTVRIPSTNAQTVGRSGAGMPTLNTGPNVVKIPNLPNAVGRSLLRTMPVVPSSNPVVPTASRASNLVNTAGGQIYVRANTVRPISNSAVPNVKTAALPITVGQTLGMSDAVVPTSYSGTPGVRVANLPNTVGQTPRSYRVVKSNQAVTMSCASSVSTVLTNNNRNLQSVQPTYSLEPVNAALDINNRFKAIVSKNLTQVLPSCSSNTTLNTITQSSGTSLRKVVPIVKFTTSSRVVCNSRLDKLTAEDVSKLNAAVSNKSTNVTKGENVSSNVSTSSPGKHSDSSPPQPSIVSSGTNAMLPSARNMNSSLWSKEDSSWEKVPPEFDESKSVPEFNMCIPDPKNMIIPEKMEQNESGITINNYFSLLTPEYDHSIVSSTAEPVTENTVISSQPVYSEPELEFIVEHYGEGVKRKSSGDSLIANKVKKKKKKKRKKIGEEELEKESIEIITDDEIEIIQEIPTNPTQSDDSTSQVHIIDLD